MHFIMSCRFHTSKFPLDLLCWTGKTLALLHLKHLKSGCFTRHPCPCKEVMKSMLSAPLSLCGCLRKCFTQLLISCYYSSSRSGLTDSNSSHLLMSPNYITSASDTLQHHYTRQSRSSNWHLQTSIVYPLARSHGGLLKWADSLLPINITFSPTGF